MVGMQPGMRPKASAALGEGHLWEQCGCQLSFCWSPGWFSWSGWCMSPPPLILYVPYRSWLLLLISTELSGNIVYLRQLSSKDKQEESAKCIRKKQAGAHFSGYQHCLFSLIQTLPPSSHQPPSPRFCRNTAQRTQACVSRDCSLNAGLFPAGVGEEVIRRTSNSYKQNPFTGDSKRKIK